MFREVSVVEIREVLRAWLAGHGLRVVATQAGWIVRLLVAMSRLRWPRAWTGPVVLISSMMS